MYLIDLKVDPTTPINRMVEQIEWAKLFPGQGPPRRAYYTFAQGKPVEIKDEKIAKFLMEKYPSIRRTSMEIDKLIAIANTLKYSALKSYALQYGWSLKDVSITHEKLKSKVGQALRSFILPMNAKEFEEFKEKRTEESKRKAERVRLRMESIAKNIAMEKKREKALKFTEGKEETRLNKIRKAVVKGLKKISDKGIKEEKEETRLNKIRKANDDKEAEMREEEEKTRIANKLQSDKEDKKTKEQE